MERRLFNTQLSRETKLLAPSGLSSTNTTATMQQQKKLSGVVESGRKTQQQQQQEHVPDLTDFMNDMFFGSVKNTSTHHNKVYNLTGLHMEDDNHHDDDDHHDDVQQEEEIDKISSISRNSTSLSHEEWLEEARRMVASSPSRCDSPSRLVVSPRFAAVQGGAQSPSLPDRRDPLSRSARRYRAVESFSGEILSKSTKHSRNKSETIEIPTSPSDPSSSPASAVHKWFSNILKPPPPPPILDSPPPAFPSRQSLHRKTRFQKDPSSPRPQGIPVPPRRTFHVPTPPLTDTKLLSPPKNLIESAHRRSRSSSTCSVEKIAPKPISNGLPSEPEVARELSLNGFLKEQRIKVGKVLDDELDARVKIVLSGPSNSTTSMVAAICYAWLLENRMRKESKDGEEFVVLPVMNVRRERMWKQKQAAWLFHHVGLEVNSLFFADEVDVESLIMAGKLSMLVVGQDVLRTNGEDGSQCTILTDNYCEDAYDLLQTPVVKKLLLAAILLDTQNLNASSQISMTRDAEAVQLLLVGSTPNYRNSLFDQLTQDQRDNSFFEALQCNYGIPPNESGHENGEHVEHGVSERKSTSIPHREDIVRYSDMKSNSARSEKATKVLPKSVKPSSSTPKMPSERKSTSIPHHEGNAQNSDKKSNGARSVKTTKVSPKSVKSSSSTTPKVPSAPDPPRGKNKSFLAKWFGF